jgi:heme oxygenase
VGDPSHDHSPIERLTARHPGTDIHTADAHTAADADIDTDYATAWGELYVVEGSALGGRLIVRRLRELHPYREHRFYAVGEDAPAAWRRFQHLLDTHLPDDASCRAAVDGARGMFARFRRTLKEPTDV